MRRGEGGRRLKAPATADQSALHAPLAWYGEMGVDVALDEAPVDRLTPQPTPVSAPPAPPAGRPLPRATPSSLPRVAVRPAVAAPTGEIERAARSVAASATTLEELRSALAAFEGCNLRLTATQ